MGSTVPSNLVVIHHAEGKVMAVEGQPHATIGPDQQRPRVAPFQT